MSGIEMVDKNLLVTGTVEGEVLQFHNVKADPFTIYGLLPCGEDEMFRRMPEDVAKNTNEGVELLHTNTSGGRVRFCTDSEKIAIRAFMPGRCLMPHMPFLGSSGFDLYEAEVMEGTDDSDESALKWSYRGSFIPPTKRKESYEAIIRLGSKKKRDLLIHFPLYDNVSDLWIGLEEDALLQEGGKYRPIKPVIYYGSSITQGGCASRPGNAYPAIISRNLNCDFVNLGFSGSGRGEIISAEYIAEQPMSVFVMDYDYNAPTPEHLAETHEPFFMAVREKNPDLPIILSSRTDPARTELVAELTGKRWEVIKRTYENALKRGDKNVYLVDGGSIFERCDVLGVAADSCTVDGTHPNDLGFACMAKVLGDAIKRVLP